MPAHFYAALAFSDGIPGKPATGSGDFSFPAILVHNRLRSSAPGEGWVFPLA
jgi:hypothetical protein